VKEQEAKGKKKADPWAAPWHYLKLGVVYLMQGKTGNSSH
jgi:hypothetical protein